MFGFRLSFASLLGFALGALIAASAGCGGAPSTSAATRTTITVETLYPMAEGSAWSFDVDTGVSNAPPTLAITRVVSARGALFELSNNGSEPVRYELREQGLFRPGSGTWLLRKPIETGASWASTSGMVAEVASMGVRVTTPAGTFEDCVLIEERGEDSTRRIATTYCPGVGPVRVLSSMSTRFRGTHTEVTAVLRGYAVSPEAAPPE
ncbi:MAG: hypothetical protein AAF355_03905 [Myxococcota bacterium]